MDYQRINKLQPEVTKADGGKGCISLIPLSKIDELNAKLKGYKVFSSLDFRSGYYHIELTESAKPKSAFVLSSLGKYQFNRVPECENCFQILKEFLQQAPILKYPDPQASYTLYRDALKYTYAGVLTQHSNGTDHPITYVSRLFLGSQLNWATLTKEAYAIYMPVEKLSFYMDTAKITVKSDHLPLKKFLEKNTLNSKVNNWVVELESQNITFEYIPGIRNTSLD